MGGILVYGSYGFIGYESGHNPISIRKTNGNQNFMEQKKKRKYNDSCFGRRKGTPVMTDLIPSFPGPYLNARVSLCKIPEPATLKSFG